MAGVHSRSVCFPNAQAPVAKLVAPRTDQLVHRRRVLSAIERGLQNGACWIAAPAGYGKTTALADYLDQKAARHIWYRVDQGDHDIASFFHYLRLSLRTAGAARSVPVFGPEYADEPEAFARRFFRAWFALLKRGTVLVLDDLHHTDAPHFRSLLAVLLHELPAGVQCACLSRALPGKELTDLRLQGKLAVIDQATLKFSEREARALVGTRIKRASASINVSAARGWAAGLVLLAERASAGDPPTILFRKQGAQPEAAAFATLASQFFDTLPRPQRDALLKLSLLPEVRPDVARSLAAADATEDLLEALQQRQLLVTRGDTSDTVFHLHDLLREFLQERIEQELSAEDLKRVREHAATLLNAAGHTDAAVALALQARAWPLAHQLIAAQAETLLSQGRRATLTEWCAALPADRLDGWLCYWLGVANMSEDATAESWFAQAWDKFIATADLRGQYLTAARAVIAKTDSWRTHEGLATWTERVVGLIEREPPPPAHDEQLLVWTGMLRAVDFAPNYHSDTPAVGKLTSALLERLEKPLPGDSTTLRLMASSTIIDHAGSMGRQEVFEQAVDSIRQDLRERTVQPWALGLWLVAFGAVSGRYFSYVRRGFSLRLTRGSSSRGDRARRARSTARRRVWRALSSAAANEIPQRPERIFHADTAPRGDRGQPLHHAGGRGGGLPGRDAHAARKFPGRVSGLRTIHGRDRSGERAADRTLAALHHPLPGAARGSQACRGSRVPERDAAVVRWWRAPANARLRAHRPRLCGEVE